MLQADSVSRKILSPLRLYTKRRTEQLHRLDNSIADSILSIRTHVNEGNTFEAHTERGITETILDENAVMQLVDDIIHTAIAVAPIIVGISKDLSLPMNQWYIYLAFPQPDAFQSDGISHCYNRRVQVPLLPFCQALASAFDEKPTSTALCFIADASSSLSSQVFSQILIQCQAELQIPVIQEPAWMITLALLMRRQAIPAPDAERILFALCRLESYRLEQLEKKIGMRYRTVVFVLPGQACTASLLPLLQKIFPHERYVFAYNGCVRSVQRGIALIKGRTMSTRTCSEKKNSNVQVFAMPRSTTATMPIVPMLNNLSMLPAQLAGLSIQMAGIVEAWMSSVDTLIALKEDERRSGYTPFVCRMDFLMNGNGNGDDEQSTTSSSRLALANVLQYITGSRSRPLADGVLDAAQSVLMDVTEQHQKEMKRYPTIAQKTRVAIEDCVFAHKMILIGDKTLPDTVVPKKEWSLKADKKLTSCACCFGGEGGDEESEGDEEGEDPGSRSNDIYVDGKASFAFDPTSFTGIK